MLFGSGGGGGAGSTSTSSVPPQGNSGMQSLTTSQPMQGSTSISPGQSQTPSGFSQPSYTGQPGNLEVCMKQLMNSICQLQNIVCQMSLNPSEETRSHSHCHKHKHGHSNQRSRSKRRSNSFEERRSRIKKRYNIEISDDSSTSDSCSSSSDSSSSDPCYTTHRSRRVKPVLNYDVHEVRRILCKALDASANRRVRQDIMKTLHALQTHPHSVRVLRCKRYD